MIISLEQRPGHHDQCHGLTGCLDPHLTTSTAPARTFGSLPMMDTLAAKEPSMLNTTNSAPHGKMVR